MLTRFQAILGAVLCALAAVAVHKLMPNSMAETALIGLVPLLTGLAIRNATDSKAIADAKAPETSDSPVKVLPGPGSGPGAIALLVLGAALLLGGTARADEPLNQLGPTVWRLTFRPVAIVGLGQVNFTKGSFSGGIAPGACYGATLDAGSWYAPSANLCLAFQVGQSVPNSLTPGFLLGFADYYYAGVAMQVTEVGGGAPMDVQWLLRFSAGLPISGTPTAVQKATQR
jgi:hypothetical protein